MSKIFCDGLVNAVLAFGPGDLGHSSRQRALSRSRTAPTAARKLICCCDRDLVALQAWDKFAIRSGRGCLCSVSVLHFFLPPPGGLCGRGWSQLGGWHTGDALWRYLGGGRPRRCTAAGALIGLVLAYTYCLSCYSDGNCPPCSCSWGYSLPPTSVGGHGARRRVLLPPPPHT
jgi:hypothetical protein